MLKKASSFVLGLSTSSTGTLPPHISAARTNVVLLIRRTVRPRGYACGVDFACGLAREGARPTGKEPVLAGSGLGGETARLGSGG
jgi:hypothetical protein